MSDVRTKCLLKENFDQFLFETGTTAIVDLCNSDREYKEKSDQFFEIMDQLEAIARNEGVVTLDNEFKEKLKDLENLYLHITSASHTATYLQGYRDGYELFRILGIIN